MFGQNTKYGQIVPVRAIYLARSWHGHDAEELTVGKGSRRAFGSLRKLPSGRWQARYTGPDLEMHAALSTFVFKKDAEAWLAEEDRLIARGEWKPLRQRRTEEELAHTTVGEYVERIIQRRATRSRKPIAQTTVDLYRKDYRLEIAEPLGNLTLAVWGAQPEPNPANARRSAPPEVRWGHP